MSDQPNKTEVTPSTNGRQLNVRCNEEDFAAVKRIVCDAVGYAEEVDRVGIVLLYRAGPKAKPPSILFRIGCYVALMLVVVIFISGILKIIDLIRG